jgi:hypothetical protein
VYGSHFPEHVSFILGHNLRKLHSYKLCASIVYRQRIKLINMEAMQNDDVMSNKFNVDNISL